MALIAMLIGAAACMATGPGRADVERWLVVPGSSSITMRVGTPVGQRTGRFTRWTGDIRFDPDAPRTAHVAIEVEANSLRMDDARLTATAVGAGFLDSGRYPRVAFRLTGLEPAGGSRFTARADITMKGVTQAVVFPATLRNDGRTAQMTGGFSLDRAAFGIGTRGPWNGLIGRQVRVDVSLATRPAA
ncbi:YceI family protein [Brevundimonas sp. NIBR11]|uniref:YceI family protein n=1 Tax=Brevundimonas sp. NIBR11 TaxID=3015999 RepID=UPI0022F063DC|nr:YceI family protein [Brevundimonas sp. NIBR11]